MDPITKSKTNPDIQHRTQIPSPRPLPATMAPPVKSHQEMMSDRRRSTITSKELLDSLKMLESEASSAETHASPLHDSDIDDPPMTAPLRDTMSLAEFLSSEPPPRLPRVHTQTLPPLAKRNSISLKELFKSGPPAAPKDDQTKKVSRKLTKRSKRGMSMSGISPPKISPPSTIHSKPSLLYEQRVSDAGKKYWAINVRASEHSSQDSSVQRSRTVDKAEREAKRFASPDRPASSVYSDARSVASPPPRPSTQPTFDPAQLVTLARMEADRAGNSTPDHFKGRTSGAGNALSSNPPSLYLRPSPVPPSTSRDPSPQPPMQSSQLASSPMTANPDPPPSSQPSKPPAEIPHQPSNEAVITDTKKGHKPSKSLATSTRERAIRERKIRDREAHRARRGSSASSSQALDITLPDPSRQQSGLDVPIVSPVPSRASGFVSARESPSLGFADNGTPVVNGHAANGAATATATGKSGGNIEREAELLEENWRLRKQLEQMGRSLKRAEDERVWLRERVAFLAQGGTGWQEQWNGFAPVAGKVRA